MLRLLTLFACVHLGSSMSFGSERPLEAGLHAALEANTPRLRVADADGYTVVQDVDQLVIGHPYDFRQSAASDVVAIAAGTSHTIALKKDGSVIGAVRSDRSITRTMLGRSESLMSIQT